MMRLDIKAARKAWIEETKVPEERKAREESDFLEYQNDDGLFADFHSNRHLFITSLERAKISPKMAQTLARHSDVRLTLGVYTHVGLHDQTAAIASLPPPPGGKDTETEAVELRATGTDDRTGKHQMVPSVVPSGAQIGAQLVAPERLRLALADCERTTLRDTSQDASAFFCSLLFPKAISGKSRYFYWQHCRDLRLVGVTRVCLSFFFCSSFVLPVM